MSDTLLVLDMDFLCHRAFYATGDLEFRGNKTGIVYGVLREILNLQERFRTDRIAFCWDSGDPIRREIYPAYKLNRQHFNLDPQDGENRRQMRKQMHALRTEYLQEIGFRNIFHQDGYEADDVVASICLNLPPNTSAIVVSSDQDLYQLLNHKVSMWNPAKKALIDEKSFTSFHKIEPARWHLVKAMAGCTSDNVKGIPGIGEVLAARFLQGEIKQDSKVYRKVIDGETVWKKNLPVVKLPFPGTRVFGLREDEVTRKGWRSVCNTLGLRTVLHQAIGVVLK